MDKTIRKMIIGLTVSWAIGIIICIMIIFPEYLESDLVFIPLALSAIYAVSIVAFFVMWLDTKDKPDKKPEKGLE